MRIRLLLIISVCLQLSGIARAQAQGKPAGPQFLSVAAPSTGADELLKVGAKAWSQITPKHIALNRTPPLYDTDEPAGLDIPSVDVRLARASGRLFVQLSWRDATQDATTLTEVPNTPPETRFRKVQTEADDRFFDAAAVMFPAKPGTAMKGTKHESLCQPGVRVLDEAGERRNEGLEQDRGQCRNQPDP